MSTETQDLVSADSEAWLALREQDINRQSVVNVPVRFLSIAGSPRIAGENLEHLKVLAEVNTELPPILVHQ